MSFNGGEERVKQDGSRAVKLEELSQEELIAKVNQLSEQLKKKNAFGLVFERQSEDAILNRKTTVPVLVEDKSKFIDNSGQDNMLLIGDNFDSLTNLLQTHRGKIDVIYIDPPYNTGNEDFIYNDNYVSPEDSFRHSKWLSFMENRLLLAKELLSENGVVFVSIDDNEQATLRLLLGLTFGEGNVEQMVWHKVGDDSGRMKVTKRFRREHEYILVCYKNISNIEFSKYEAERNYKNEYTNPDQDPRGAYKQGIISHTENKSKVNGKNYFEVITPSGRIVKRQWRVTQEEFNKLVEDNRIYFGKSGDSIPSLKVFIAEMKMETPMSIISELGTAKSAGIKLREILGEGTFNYPKPVELIKRLIHISTANRKDAVMLDFFAGSGTTGHAVLELNQEDGGNRQFILCTNDEAGIGETVTYERIKRVITGKDWSDGKEHEPHEASLRYYKVEHIKRDDELTLNLLNALEGVVQIREESHISFHEANGFKVFTNKLENKYVAILNNRRKLEELITHLEELNPSTLTIYNNGSNYMDEDCIIDLVNKGWTVSFVKYPDELMNDYKFVDDKFSIQTMEGNN